ncbi:MAG: DUF4271 domain-containing protein [Bacteroidales bacterium]|nr:DUF4271 domain-containing protein [Bacteroidales bacterium]
MPVRNNVIDFYSAVEKYSESQDTVISNSVSVQRNDTINIPKDIPQTDSVRARPKRELDLSAIDSILRRSEERDRQIELQLQEESAIQRQIYRRKTDTTELLYKQFGIAGFPLKEKLTNDPFQQNFLYNINNTKPVVKKVKQDVFIEQMESVTSVVQNEKEIKPKYISGRIQFDWITILLIGSFLLLGWVRLFNKKYLTSLIKSVISVQESNTMYREKNSLMVRASFIINLLFISNISVFTIQIRHFFDLKLNGTEDYTLYFIVLFSILTLYIFRAASSFFVGTVFLKQKVFSEYFHNVNIFTKNNGLLIFPVIIALQFLSYEYISFIIYTGIIASGLLYLLQTIRAVQIIIRKNVSIFYMILYLCAFEFSPFLIVYKVLLYVE